MVLSDKIPQLCHLSWEEEGLRWQCECGKTSLCSHGAALLVWHQEAGHLPSSNLIQTVKSWYNKEKVLPPEVKPSEQLDLFGLGELFSPPGGVTSGTQPPARDHRELIEPGEKDNTTPEDVEESREAPTVHRVCYFLKLEIPGSPKLRIEPLMWEEEEDLLSPFREEALHQEDRAIFGNSLGTFLSYPEYQTPIEVAVKAGFNIPEKLYFGHNREILQQVQLEKLSVRFRETGRNLQGATEYEPYLIIPFEDKEILWEWKRILMLPDRLFSLMIPQKTLFMAQWEPWVHALLEELLHHRKGMDALGVGALRSKFPIEGAPQVDFVFQGEELLVREVKPRLVLSLEPKGEGLEIYYRFQYGEEEISYRSDKERWVRLLEKGKKEVVPRDTQAESRAMAQLAEIASETLRFERGYYSTVVGSHQGGDVSLDMDIADFLLQYGRALMENAIQVRLKDQPIKLEGALKFSVKSDVDWFEVKAGVGEEDFEPIELDENYQAYNLVKSASEYVVLNPSDLRRLEFLRKQGLDDSGLIEVPAVNFNLIDTIYEDIANKEEGLLQEKRELYQKIRSFESIAQQPPPENLQATLRNYQLSGYNWLLFLHDYNLGGCLADDMGLGKTIQSLSLLQNLKERGILTTSLLIAPVVTMANWESEAKRFTPDLKVYRHSGTGRIQDSQLWMEYDLIIVSYHTLRNDLDLFLEKEFYYILLDEAHYIKNASSQIFKAIRTLRSRHRLSITGTPIENNTLELWSQMNFLNPGLLGTRGEFTSSFATPIEKYQDQEAAENLRRTVFPFILRRKKEDVLEDLPPKEVIVQYSEMAPAQAEVYNRYKKYYKQKLLGLIEEQGVQKSAMEIFKSLLRLRQIAIHPSLADPDWSRIPSTKMDSVNVILDEVHQEDHKILIFSQFISALDVVRDHLDSMGWSYSYLTGKTADRTHQIEQFQNDKNVKVFLLSLKAGGVGINLTAADYVVLLDPWWNPAAERQAIDRAHRMGQTRRVISYKMIVKDTIEEKILHLQEKKNALVEEIISEEESLFKKLSRDDILGLFD